MMDSLGVVYPQYWLQFDVEYFFWKHLDVIKENFCHPKKLGSNDICGLEVLLATSLVIQQSLFKLAMKSNACAAMTKPLDVNHLTRL
jgi:hypothetical protein